MQLCVLPLKGRREEQRFFFFQGYLDIFWRRLGRQMIAMITR